jgi:hypothetical protein
VGSCEVDASGSGYRPVADSCEHGNEPSGSIKGGNFLEQLSDYQLLKQDSPLVSLLVSYSVNFHTANTRTDCVLIMCYSISHNGSL